MKHLDRKQFNNFLAKLCLFILLNEGGFILGSASNVEMEVARNILKNYDGEVRPRGANGTGPTEVSVNLYLRSINELDPEKMIWTTQITFRMQWLDARLRFDSAAAAGKNASDLKGIRFLTMPQSLRSKLWKPDLFFSNEIQMHFHNALLPNEYYRIFPNGEVLHSTRLTVTLSCPMTFKMFPHESQTCSMRLASYGFTTEDIIFKWKTYDPAQVTGDLHIPIFSLKSFTTDYCDSQTNTGVYSCLRLDLLFQREFSRYFTEIYFSLAASVILAWLSFWLNPMKLNIPRVVILALSLLCLKTTSSELMKSISRVSYTTLADRWVTVCSTFIYLAIIEYVLVTFLATRNVETIKGQELLLSGGECCREETELREINLSSDNQNEQSHETESRRRSIVLLGKHLHFQDLYANLKSTGWSTSIDNVFRAMYPIAFVLFIVVYLANVRGTSEN